MKFSPRPQHHGQNLAEWDSIRGGKQWQKKELKDKSNIRRLAETVVPITKGQFPPKERYRKL